MQFGMYLVENGVLTCEELFEALKLQVRSRPKLGAVAIKNRKLTCHQVFQILEAQCDEPLEFFGELALRMGFLTKTDLAHLVGEQQAMTASLRELLVEHSFISEARADWFYNEYRNTLRQSEMLPETV